MKRLAVLQSTAPSAGSHVVYRGPSALNGAPIVAILTGTAHTSRNAKTGAMAQLWILPMHEAPHVAQASGADEAVCGDCPLRPSTSTEVTCYVRTFQGPRATWERNRHAPVDLDGACAALAASGLALRLGAYGDPAALPAAIVRTIAASATSTAGYTHQWRKRPFAWLRRFAMASVESRTAQRAAVAKGWRTFRVLRKDALASGVLASDEILCPAETRGVQCATCRLCSGAREGNVKSIAIHAH